MPQSPTDQILRDIAAIAMSWLAIAGVGGFAALAIRFVRGRKSILPIQRLRAPGWTGPLVLVAFLVFYLTPAFLLPTIDADVVVKHLYGHKVDEETARHLAASVADLLGFPSQIAAWAALLFLTGRRPIVRLPRRTAPDAVAGYLTWLLLTPVVYAVSMAAAVITTLIVGGPPPEHPIMQTLQSAPLTTGVIVLLAVQAVIAAPIREEIFFRGILQPWLANRPWGGELAIWLAAVFGLSAHWPGRQGLTDWLSVLGAAAPVLFILAVLPLYWRLDSWNLTRALPVRDAPTRRQAARAIVGTSLLFANLHANVWPTPIPLFVLALGLGWLAFRTQGVVGPIVVHVLFNAIVFVAMTLRPQIPPPPPPAQGNIGNVVTVAVAPPANSISSFVPASS